MINIAHVARVARKAATQELLAGFFLQVGFSGFKVLGLCGYSEFAGSIFEVSCLRGLEVNPEPEALSPKPLNVCLCVCASFRAGFERFPMFGGCAAISCVFPHLPCQSLKYAGALGTLNSINRTLHRRLFGGL